MTEKDAGAPCPPVEETDDDNVLANETEADYTAEEVTE